MYTVSFARAIADTGDFLVYRLMGLSILQATACAKEPDKLKQSWTDDAFHVLGLLNLSAVLPGTETKGGRSAVSRRLWMRSIGFFGSLLGALLAIEIFVGVRNFSKGY